MACDITILFPKPCGAHSWVRTETPRPFRRGGPLKAFGEVWFDNPAAFLAEHLAS
jgi:hypothetical protein